MACYDRNVARWVPLFAGFTDYVATIPKLYWNIDSQEQRIHTICAQLHKLVCYADMLGNKVNINREDIDELQGLFEKFMQSGFDDYYADQVETWIDEHLQYIYDHTVKQVYFGLTLEGYFVAYIPESWDDIAFDTGMQYGLDTYGRLILRWNTDATSTVDQTPEQI